MEKHVYYRDANTGNTYEYTEVWNLAASTSLHESIAGLTVLDGVPAPEGFLWVNKQPSPSTFGGGVKDPSVNEVEHARNLAERDAKLASELAAHQQAREAQSAESAAEAVIRDNVLEKATKESLKRIEAAGLRPEDFVLGYAAAKGAANAAAS